MRATTDPEVLPFKVAGQDFAIDLGMTREIRSWIPPDPLPNSPESVLGMLNFRGELVPLINLGERLGFATSDVNERSVVVVAEVDGEPIGLLVDAVSDIVALKEDDTRPPPRGANSDGQSVVKLLLIKEEKLVRVLDLAVIASEAASQDGRNIT